MYRYFHFYLLFTLAVFIDVAAQENNRSLRFDLNDTGTNYIQFVGNGQVWFQASQLNPGGIRGKW